MNSRYGRLRDVAHRCEVQVRSEAGICRRLVHAILGTMTPEAEQRFAGKVWGCFGKQSTATRRSSCPSHDLLFGVHLLLLPSANCNNDNVTGKHLRTSERDGLLDIHPLRAVQTPRPSISIHRCPRRGPRRRHPDLLPAATHQDHPEPLLRGSVTMVGPTRRPEQHRRNRQHPHTSGESRGHELL